MSRRKKTPERDRQRPVGAPGPRKAPVPRYFGWIARLIGGVIPGAILLSLIVISGYCNTFFASVHVPGTVEVALDAGSYSVFYQYPERTSWRNTPEVEFELRTIRGPDIRLEPAQELDSYTAGTRSFVALNDFHLPEPRRYELTARYTAASTRRDIVIGIGRGPAARQTLLAWAVGLVVVGIPVCLGVLVLLVRHVRKHYDVSRR